MTRISVAIADDHTLFRVGIRKLLQTFEGMDLAGEAGDGQEAVRLVAERRPRILLMDIGMPGLNGVEAAARITKDFPETRVIILSMHTGEEHVLRAIRAGAAGYVLKDAPPAELESAVRSVARGETYLSPAVSRYVVEGYVRQVAGGTGPPERLTARQREILQLIAEGHTTKAIAVRLRLSVKTVEAHRAQIMERLEIRDIPGLVRFAIRAGLVGLDA